MDSRGIKSTTPVEEGISDSPLHRIIPVDIHGKPITDLSKTGGWVATFFIFGNEMAERMAYFGLAVNMVVFMFSVMHMPISSSANAVNNFLGISQASSVLGSFLADAYLGRYRTIAIFTTIYLMGLTGITLCATVSVFVPNQEDCDQLSLLLGHCETAKPWQMMYLYTFLYITGFGAAGIRPCVSSFGADQFDEQNPKESQSRSSFFNWWNFGMFFGAILSGVILNYIQDNVGWDYGFGITCISMMLTLTIFLLVTKTFRYSAGEDKENPLIRISRVFVAAIMNCRTTC